MHSWLPGFHFQCICFIYAGFPHLITVNNITVCPLSFSSLWRKYHRLIWIHPVSKLSSPLPTQQGLRLVHHCAPWLCHLISLHQVSLSCGLACVYWKHVVSQTKNRKETLGIVNIAVLSRINIREMNKTQLIQHEKIYLSIIREKFFVYPTLIKGSVSVRIVSPGKSVSTCVLKARIKWSVTEIIVFAIGDCFILNFH